MASDLVAWWDCTHQGIGLPGCPTCDGRFDYETRVSLREARDEIGRLREGWVERAMMGRALRMWMGGLDGPPPNWPEIEARCADLAGLCGAAHALDDLRRSREILAAAKGAEALEATALVLRRLDWMLSRLRPRSE